MYTKCKCLINFHLLLVISVAHGKNNKLDCNIAVHNSSEFSPLILQNKSSSYEFVVPKSGKINLDRGEKWALACPGARNWLLPSNANVSSAACLSGDKISVANQEYKFSEVECKRVIHGKTQPTQMKCGNGEGRVIHIGYALTKKQWFTLIEVCYVEESGITLYSKHSIMGQDIKTASKSNHRPGFSTESLNHIPAAVAYKMVHQKAMFNSLLGSAALAETYINERSFLSRGHLSPDADFIYAAWQFATYFYINACPQWQAINAGRWKSVEKAVRKKAAGLGREITVFTGTHDVLSLPDVNGNPTEIYLISGDKLPVPKFLWKIAYDNATAEAAVFVVLNNPFVDDVPQERSICENFCSEYGWGSPSWYNTRKGIVWCCNYESFAEVVHTAPELRVKGVLSGIQTE